MNSSGSERRRTLEAPGLMRSQDPPPGSVLAALRRTESSLTHGAATPVHCRVLTSGSETSILPTGGGDIPPGPWTAAPEEKTFLVAETNLKRRTDERQKHAERKPRSSAATARTRTLIPRSSRCWSTVCSPPAPNRAGRPCRALLYVPRGVNLDLTYPETQRRTYPETDFSCVVGPPN